MERPRESYNEGSRDSSESGTGRVDLGLTVLWVCSAYLGYCLGHTGRGLALSLDGGGSVTCGGWVAV